MKINITAKAAAKLKEMLGKNGQGKNVRIMMTGIGWGGPRFGIALDEQKNNDQNINIENLDFVIEQDLADQFNGFSVDYQDFFLNKGFQVYAEGYNSSCC